MSSPNNLYKECFVTSGGVCREPPQTSLHAILNASDLGHLSSYDGLRRLCRPNNNLHDLLRHTQKRTMASLIALNSPNLHPLPRSSQSHLLHLHWKFSHSRYVIGTSQKASWLTAVNWAALGYFNNCTLQWPGSAVSW
jgi:hypothetical protein